MDDARLLEELVFDGQQYRSKILQLIRKSQIEILISTYILESDEFGSLVFKELEKKAQAGIQIRLLVDGLGSWPWIKGYEYRFKKNLQTRVYHPLPWPFSRFHLSQIPRVDRFINWVYQANRRNHQKLFVFDRLLAIVGSRNINDDAIVWRETNLIIQGPDVYQLVEIFNSIWSKSHDLLLGKKSEITYFPSIKNYKKIFSGHSFKARNRKKREIYRKIQHAKRKIYITTPYLNPNNKVLKILTENLKRGVDVRILLPDCSDVPISKWISQLFYERLLVAGVKIYEYHPRVLHAKTIMVDQWALVGSSNFNHRSMIRDLELDYQVRTPTTLRVLEEKFFEDLKQAKMIEYQPKMSIFKRALSKALVYLFPSSF